MLTKNGEKSKKIALIEEKFSKKRGQKGIKKIDKLKPRSEKPGQIDRSEEKLRGSVSTRKVKSLGDIDLILEKIRSLSLAIIPVRQVAEILGIDRKTILSWCEKRLIMAEEISFGNKTSYKIPTHSVILFLESQRVLAEVTKKQIGDHTPYVEGWINAMKQGMIPGSRGGYTEQTIMNYTLRIKKFLQSYRSVTYHHVRERLAEFTDRSSNKVQEYRAIVSFSKYLFGEEAMDEKNYGKITGKSIRPKGNPTPTRRRVPYQDYRTMILKGCYSLEDKAIVHILFHTGMRASEFCGIKPEHVDLEKRELFIPKAKGHKQRLLGLNRTACAAFSQYLKHTPREEGEYLFLNDIEEQMHRCGVFARIKRIAKNAGVDKSKISPHAFRRSFGTFNLQKGRSVKSVQLALGHSKPSVTLEIYDTTTQQEVANMMKNW
ncbi:MAG: tyrosine-type recombinase/integrase [Vampirovibrionales bacterium]|nr:tyrosine-type recombinase/integrase [Vampirovibrionales bacterium]